MGGETCTTTKKKKTEEDSTKIKAKGEKKKKRKGKGVGERRKWPSRSHGDKSELYVALVQHVKKNVSVPGGA